MSGKKRWASRPFKTLKIKVFSDILERYQRVVKAKGRNMQEDFEKHIEDTLK